MQNTVPFVSFSPVLGLSDEQVWSQVFHKKTEENECFVTFSIEGEKSREEGKKILALFSSTHCSSPEECNTFIKKVTSTLSDKHCSLAVLYLFKESLYAWSFGQASVFVKRNEKVGNITHSDILRVISGPWKDGDIYALTTKHFTNMFENPFTVDENDIDLLSMKALTKVQDFPNSVGIAVMYLKISAQDEDVQQEETVKVIDPPSRNSGVGKIEVGSGKLTKKVIGKIGELIHKRHIVIRTYDKKINIKKIGMILVGVLVLTLMFLFVVKQMNASKEKKKTELLSPYVERVEKAKSIFSTDKNASRQEIDAIVVELEKKSLEYSKNSFEYKSLTEYLNNVKEYSASVSSEKSTDNLSVYYDFRLMKSDFIGKNASLSENMAYYFDPEGKAIVALNLLTKQANIISVENIPNGKDLVVVNKSIYVLSEDGVFSVSLSGESRKIIEKDDLWKRPSLIAAFGSNVYVLDKESRQILKYVSDGSSFGKATTWIKSAQGFDLSSAQTMLVDGKLWISSSDGTIGVFSQGLREPFLIKGLSEALNSMFYIYTDPDSEHVYMLEPSSQRLVVSNKSRELQQVIKSKQFAGATNLLIMEKEKKAYIGVGSIVYEVSL